MHNLVYWIWLSLACSPGTATFPRLIEKFHDAREIYEADIKDITRCIDPRSSDRANLNDKSLDKANEIYEYCTKKNIGMLSYDDPKYPNSLKQIPSPPILMYYRGVLPDFNKEFFVSVVGTRSISDYGRKNAFKISYDLSTAGAVIVSGMAMGIDGISHAAALEADKKTVAILGNGIDICYPQQHIKLAREIVKSGCIMTEFPPHTPPAGRNFPIRNRIISGLSVATIVIEGHERSGARITANCAIEQKRALYALPGNIGSKNSEVTSLLLKNGAKAITSADDLIRDFENKCPGALNPFNFDKTLHVDIMSALSKYLVVAVSPSDDIFPGMGRPRRQAQTNHKEDDIEDINENDKNNNPLSEAIIDADTFNIYKKIPLNGTCPIESLVDPTHDLRDVMKYLLKLEMGCFVKIYPGDIVARKKN